jgi:nucleotide-binding universal stress UspA family protein
MPRLPDRRSRENTQGSSSTTASPAPMVLVATDGTPSSRVAVEKGLSIAGELGARVAFVSAFRQPSGALGKPFYQRSLRKRLAVSRDALAEAKMAAEAFGTDAEYEIVEGTPANAIADIAAARGADLVVVGSRRLTIPALRRSVSRALVTESDSAVLVAKEGRHSGPESNAGRWTATNLTRAC